MLILEFIMNHLMEWLFAGISTAACLCLRIFTKRLNLYQKQNAAIAEGVVALLRENIISNFNKYNERGNCPIYAKESIRKVYKAYSDLGGNDVAKDLYNKILDMESSP
ncbi:MAG: hypothetical protein FWG91_10160 [Lachnospiraceae bacterium]|nr:hypothetical protein [Lachnospiraceae bacterium]